MKQYFISEEELIQCIKDWTIQGYVPAYFIKNNFLKSKTPVEVIAEGEVWFGSNYYKIGEKYKEKIAENLKKYDGKKVRMLIEEIE